MGAAAVAATDHRALLAFVLASSSVAHADHGVSASTFVYTDDDSLTVVHPSVAANVGLTEDTSATLQWDADVITAATVDVRTSASVRPFHETRHGGAIGIRHALSRTLAIGAGYRLSISPDHRSYTGSVRIELETDSRLHTFALDARAAYNEIGRARDARRVGELWAAGLNGWWTAVLSSRALLDLGLAFDWNHGYLESPYRFVRIVGQSGQSVFLPEEVPDDRARGAFSARLRLAVSDAIFLRGAYRFHADDWGVVGHTIDVNAIASHRAVSVTLGARLFVQKGASFYDGNYESYPRAPTLRTRDRELASSFAGRLLASLRWRFVERARGSASLVLRTELHQHRYIDTPLLPRRRALVTGLSLIGEM